MNQRRKMFPRQTCSPTTKTRRRGSEMVRIFRVESYQAAYEEILVQYVLLSQKKWIQYTLSLKSFSLPDMVGGVWRIELGLCP